jgi:hypothetical protein
MKIIDLMDYTKTFAESMDSLGFLQDVFLKISATTTLDGRIFPRKHFSMLALVRETKRKSFFNLLFFLKKGQNDFPCWGQHEN